MSFPLKHSHVLVPSSQTPQNFHYSPLRESTWCIFSPLDSGLPTFIVTLALPKVTHCASGVLCLDTYDMDAAGHRLRQGGENVDGRFPSMVGAQKLVEMVCQT